MLSDKELVGECIGGNQEAWREFCDRYAALIQSVVRKIFLSFGFEFMGKIEDAVQYSYTVLLEDDCRRLRAFKGNSKFSTYLRVVVHNTTIDYLRKLNPDLGRAKLLPIEYAPSYSPKVIDEIEMKEEKALLAKAIDELPPKAKIMLKLFYGGKKLKEISSILNVPIGTVESTIFRSVDKIKKIISKDLK